MICSCLTNCQTYLLLLEYVFQLMVLTICHIHVVNPSTAEITMFENNIVVYKFVQDLHFFVTGSEDENELILVTVLQGFFDSVGLVLRGNVDKVQALENLDLILLCMDEIDDGGIILETDANVIAEKVATRSIDAGAPLSEQTLTQALATAREQLTRSLLK
uniref:Coatomer subunit zeta n=1 Tax=Rhizophora mucronata TaxID=61149 RepID=A0A2P2MC82_RHIMU